MTQRTKSDVVAEARKHDSNSKWEIGRLATEWKDQFGGTDQEFADEIGGDWSRPMVNQARQAWSRFSECYMCNTYPNLTWSHFREAIGWDDANVMLKWADKTKATVAGMIRHRQGDAKPVETQEPVTEHQESAVSKTTARKPRQTQKKQAEEFRPQVAIAEDQQSEHEPQEEFVPADAESVTLHVLQLLDEFNARIDGAVSSVADRDAVAAKLAEHGLTISDGPVRIERVRTEQQQPVTTNGNGNHRLFEVESEPVQKTPKKRGNLATYLKKPFEVFWAEYDKKVGRKKAFEKFVAAVKEKSESSGIGIDAAAEEITKAATAYAATFADSNDSFKKHPATWLNGGCYDDDPAVWKSSVSNGHTANTSHGAFDPVAGEMSREELRRRAMQ